MLTAAISAIDMALHDAVGRSLGIPVYQLLGGAQRDKVPCFGTALTDSGGPGMVEEAQQMVESEVQRIREHAEQQEEAEEKKQEEELQRL